MRRLGALGLVVLAAIWLAGASLAAPDVAAASKPRISSLTTAANFEGTVTLGATIEPEGLETTYEFLLEREGGAEVVGSGTISGSESAQEVSVDVKSLAYEHTYRWAVRADNSDGPEENEDTFTTGAKPPPGCPEGCGPTVPFKPPEEPWIHETLERNAREAVLLQQEREAKKRHEEEEVAAKERALREQGERAAREAIERERLAALANAAHCVVPHLRGRSLGGARHALRAAHCSLGKVKKPAAGAGRLVVSAQGARAGIKLAEGTRVGVTLSAAPASKSRR